MEQQTSMPPEIAYGHILGMAPTLRKTANRLTQLQFKGSWVTVLKVQLLHHANAVVIEARYVSGDMEQVWIILWDKSVWQRAIREMR